MNHPNASIRARRARGAFTLVELLVTITIIGILTSLFLGALSASAESAREARTKSMIARLNTVVMTRWESYRTRRVPVNTSGLNPALANMARLLALRELQRLEMPARWSDITADQNWPTAAPALASGTSGLGNLPALSTAYLRRYNSSGSAPTVQYQGAECLYLIVTMGAIDDESMSLDQFKSMDVGDVDRDGMPEFLDGWGNPITFIRWPTNFPSDLQPDLTALIAAANTTSIMQFSRDRHDPFDPAMIDLPGAGAPWPYTRLTTNPTGYRLTPLIMSAGPDGSYSVANNQAGSDPYDWPTAAGSLAGGTPLTATTDPPADGDWLDNIHNHHLGSLTK